MTSTPKVAQQRDERMTWLLVTRVHGGCKQVSTETTTGLHWAKPISDSEFFFLIASDKNIYCTEVKVRLLIIKEFLVYTPKSKTCVCVFRVPK